MIMHLNACSFMRHNIVVLLCIIFCWLFLLCKPIEAEEVSNILASGKDGDINWVIDMEGYLHLTGKGNYLLDENKEYPEWCDYSAQVTEAIVNITDITSTKNMFCGLHLKKIDISGLNTSKVKDFTYMFGFCDFSQIDLSNFDTSNAVVLQSMFYGCSNLESIDLSKCNTSKVDDFSHMFSMCENITNINFGNIDTSSATNMKSMFWGCKKLKVLDLTNYDTRNVTDFEGMFTHCENLNRVDLSSFNTNNAVSLAYMFSNCNSLSEINFGGINTSNVVYFNGMFKECINLKQFDFAVFDTSSGEEFTEMFNGCSSLQDINLSNLRLSSATNMKGFLKRCSALKEVDLNGLDTKNVENMSWMFYGCTGLNSIDLHVLDLSSVIFFDKAFAECRNLESINLDGVDTSKAYSFYSMFENCVSLEQVDVSSFNTTNIRNISYMFSGCSKLVKLDISEFKCISFIPGGTEGFVSNCGKLNELVMPADFIVEIELPSDDEYYWVNNNGQICTKTKLGVSESVTYLRIIKEEHIHTWDNGEITMPATETAEWVKVYTCTVCGQTKTEVIPAAGVSEKESSSTLAEGNVLSENNNVPNIQQPETPSATDISSDDVAPMSTAKMTEGSKVNVGDGSYEVISVKEQTVTWVAPANKNATSITVPETVTVSGKKYKVTKIADNAFKNNKKIKKVKVSKNITEIGKNAFKGCKNLKTVNAGKDVKIIGDSAFESCSSLTSLTVEKKVERIGKKAFYNCKGLKKIYFKSEKLKSVGKAAFKKINKNYRIKVIKKYMKKYQKLMKGKIGA